MHYKNGTPASAGDSVVWRDYNNTVKTGILLDVVPASTCCNGMVARPGGLAAESVYTKNLYKVDEALQALEAQIAATATANTATSSPTEPATAPINT